MRFVMVRRAPRLASILALAILLLGGTSPAPADDQITPDVLKKVKQATVRLRVTLADGSQVEGSGFFGAGPGLILTNAHVLGMLRPESRKPIKIDVVVNSGEPDEKTLVGRPLGVDSTSDLAVIAVPPRDAPPSLSVATADDLKETQPLFIFGFPFGEALGKNLTVSKTSVSSLRTNEFGKVMKIQVNGGMHPGNSGGPVIDAEGKVVGVAVAGIKGTQINFAVPARLVQSFLSGRIHQRITGAPFKDGDDVKIPMTISTIDPLNRLRMVRVVTWTGNPGKARLIPEKERAPLPGESPRKTQDLEYKAGVARGEVAITEVPPGKVLWVEAHVIDQNGRDSWVSAYPHALSPPLDRKPATLGYKHQAGRRGWAVVAESTLKIRDAEGTDHDVVFRRQADVIQTLDGKVSPVGEAMGILTYNKAKMTLTVDGKEIPLPEPEGDALKQINQIRTTVRINPQGEYVEYRPDFKAVPPGIRDEVAGFVVGLLKSFDAARAPIPAEEVAFGKPWKGTRELMIGSTGPTEPAVVDLTYSYLGSRTRLGRPEVLINLEGRLRGQKGEGVNVSGKMRGEAAVDLETGQVVFANATVDVDIDMGEGRRKKRASGTYTVTLSQLVFKSDPEKK
jgi:S1-C subfamily serine protease